MSVSGRRALTVTMWAGWAEWDEAYAWLFAMDDAAARARGVARVATWRSRGRLPLAVEATASLVEAGLAESAEGGVVSEHALQLQLAMVITRFVNGVVDPLQQFARAVSVKRLAQASPNPNPIPNPHPHPSRSRSRYPSRSRSRSPSRSPSPNQEIKLPTALVDLRHECTHQRLPSLAGLRLAADEALLWLHEQYWMPQREVLTQLPR